MNNLKACAGDNSDDFILWSLSVRNVAKLMNNDPKDICFVKAEGTLLNCLYSLLHRKMSLYTPKEKMRAELSKVATLLASHASHTLINYKERRDESLTSFIYRWWEFLLYGYCTSVEQCRDELKINLFSSKLLNKRHYLEGHSKST